MRWNTASRNVRGVRSGYPFMGTLEVNWLERNEKMCLEYDEHAIFSRSQGDTYRSPKRGEGKCQKSWPITSGYVGKKQARSMTG
jgi:hypothetical protein